MRVLRDNGPRPISREEHDALCLAAAAGCELDQALNTGGEIASRARRYDNAIYRLRDLEISNDELQTFVAAYPRAGAPT